MIRVTEMSAGGFTYPPDDNNAEPWHVLEIIVSFDFAPSLRFVARVSDTTTGARQLDAIANAIQNGARRDRERDPEWHA